MFKRAFPRVLPTAETLSTQSISRRPRNPPVKLSPLTRVAWHQQSIRHGSTTAAAKKLFKENPFSITLASLIILTGVGGLFYAGFIYKTYIIGDFEAYPEEVANKLRRALYYHNIDLQPQNALKYYQQALELSEKMNMDPFSDEILGVKLQVAALMEETHNPLKAIEVLSLIHADCLRWLEKLGDTPGNEGRRTAMLVRCVRMSVRIGELYSSDAIGSFKAAEEHLAWAVTVLLRERERREIEGVKEGEGPWMDKREMSAALEQLGNNYFEREQYSLACPLFLKAYSLRPLKSCRQVPLMLNIAICLAEQQPSPTVPGAKLSLLADARVWAKKTIAAAESMPPEDDSEFCDHVCVAAMITLGEIARTARIARERGASMEGGWRGGLEKLDQRRMIVMMNSMMAKARRHRKAEARIDEREEVGSGEMEGVSSDKAEEVSSGNAEEVSSGKAKEVSSDKAEEVSSAKTEEVSSAETEEEWDGDEIGITEAEERHWFENALRLSRKIGNEYGARRALKGLRDLEDKE